MRAQADIALERMREHGGWLDCAEIGRMISENTLDYRGCDVQRGQAAGLTLYRRGHVVRRVSTGGRFGKYQYRVSIPGEVDP